MNIKEILHNIMDYLLMMPSTKYYRAKDGRRMYIKPNGSMGVDMKDPQTNEIYIKYMRDSYARNGAKMDKIIRRNRQRIEEERNRRCCCRNGK